MNNNVKKDIMLSVCMITYNHEEFIAQAIDGVIMQHVDFPIEIVIGEDCGTDRTREICLEYKEKYPDIIKLNFPEKNVGAQNNFLNTLVLCSGKYIALCEGDDYWIDPNKLQQQVDFLENNQEFVISSHNSVILGHNKKMLYDPPLKQTELSIHDLICGHWGIMTASIVFRRSDFNIPNWFSQVKNGDYALQLLLTTKGNIHYIPEYMSVYRRHLGGATAVFNPLYASEAIYFLFKNFNRETNFIYSKDIKSKLNRLYYENKETAFAHNLKKQGLALSVLYYFSKLGIDMMPIITKFIH